MGGIGDYSGCLVLQKPTAEACHVACQRHPLAKQKLWKHIQNRHKGHSKLAHTIACFSKSSCQSQNICVNSSTSSYTGNLQSEMPGDSKTAFLHWGDVVGFSVKLFLRASPCMQAEHMHISTAFSQLQPYQADMCRAGLVSMMRGHCMLMIPTSSDYRPHLVFACRSVVGSRLS